MLSYALIHQGHSLGDNDVQCLHYGQILHYGQLYTQHMGRYGGLLHYDHGMHAHAYLKLDDDPQLCAGLRYVDLREVHRLREDEIRRDDGDFLMDDGDFQRCG